MVGVRKTCEQLAVAFNFHVPTAENEHTHDRYGAVITLEFPSLLVVCMSQCAFKREQQFTQVAAPPRGRQGRPGIRHQHGQGGQQAPHKYGFLECLPPRQ